MEDRIEIPDQQGQNLQVQTNTQKTRNYITKGLLVAVIILDGLAIIFFLVVYVLARLGLLGSH